MADARANLYIGGDSFNRYFVCAHCGRTWQTSGGRPVGFVKAGAAQHAAHCRDRTPKERRHMTERDRKLKYERDAINHGNPTVVTYDYEHPGMKDSPVAGPGGATAGAGEPAPALPGPARRPASSGEQS